MVDNSPHSYKEDSMKGNNHSSSTPTHVFEKGVSSHQGPKILYEITYEKL